MNKCLKILLLYVLLGNFAFADSQRIISLAPNITEILFAIGAGSKTVGVSAYSNYPKAAERIPIVSNAGSINYEAIIKLKPTLILAWDFGDIQQKLQWFKKLHIRVYIFKMTTIDAIPKAIKKIGQLTQHQKQAQKIVEQFVKTLHSIKPLKKQPPKVFYVLWQNPLMTVGKPTLINQAIAFCGGKNIFADIHLPAPQVSIASVIQKNPDIIIVGAHKDSWIKYFNRWKTISAVENRRIEMINASLLARPGPRFALGVQKLCKIIR